MGHKISKEQIDPGVKDHIMSFVGDVADLETEVNSDIISAVNSLIVDRADNIESIGKLAKAIGEPVTANDSIDEVVDKVDELVTDFKSKVLNAGIMYESGDRFKELIAKLEGLVAGEGGNSGIQFASGTYDVASDLISFTVKSSHTGYILGNNCEYFTNYSIDFEPSIMFFTMDFNAPATAETYAVLGSVVVFHDLINDVDNVKVYGGHKYYEDDINRGGNSICASYEYNGKYSALMKNNSARYNDINDIQFSNCNYYAIGVGEGQEDNTLLETLKGILTDEQVVVSDEDTMADLIVKVDTEFAEKNNEMNSAKDRLYELMTEGGYDVNGSMSLNDMLGLLELSGISISDIKQIACGYGFAYIVKNDGTLYACGVNDRGQLGMGDVNRRDTFTQITNTNINSNIKQVACGYAHAIILKNDGTLWGTGNNTCSELGLGNTSEYIYNPVQITNNVSDVKEIFCGGCSYSNSSSTTIWDTTFMLKNDGTLWACGYNNVGQLGISSPLGNINKFTQVSTNVSDVKEIFSGGISTFMLKNDGTLWATGDNSCGQLGLGNTTQKTTFTKVNVTDVKQVAFLMSNDYFQNISQYGVYMLKNDGTLWACGYNTNYYLGLNDSTDKKTFTQVTKNINNDIKNIYANRYQVVALTNNNELYVKGQYAGLSQNDWNMNYDKFTKVTTNINNDVLKVNCGGTFTIVLKHDSTLWATGGFCLSTTSDTFEFGKCARGV